MTTQLTDDEFGHLLGTFDRDAFRLELQRQYLEAAEADTVAKFLSGSPEPPTEVPYLKAWFDHVSDLTARGRRIERVRVHEDAPTPYQRWERWIGAWNVRAGERMRYTTRSNAQAAGLLPAAGSLDWWLLDSSRLITMAFDEQGRRIRTELVTDPVAVQQACTWRDLAVRCSVPEESGRAF